MLGSDIFRKFAGGSSIFSLTIFLSAFLLFVIQPVAGKHILPYFGGSSSVWATSLLFFTGMLFVGYAYVYVLTTLDGRTQVRVHASLVLLAAIATLVAIRSWHSMYPSLEGLASVSQPSLGVLLALFFGIGAPYFVLSTTGPLLQFWYGLTFDREPYQLYALSNAGSLIALLAYPFLIEPRLSLHETENAWVLLFACYALASVAICWGAKRAGRVAARASIHSQDETNTGTRALYVALAALPSFLMVATTTEITQTIAPVPLLWVVPLAFYLITYILAFRGYGSSIFTPLILLGACAFAYVSTATDVYHVSTQISSYLFLLFVAGLFAHATLYSLRPKTRELPLFYLLLSFGGMLGALCAGMLAPLLFDSFWEFPFGLALAAAAGALALSEQFFPRILDAGRIRLAKIIMLFGIAVLFTRLMAAPYEYEVPFVASRDFYGAVQVRFHNAMTSLMHGTTLHGIQSTDRSLRFLPSSYYTPGSGVGRAIIYEQDLRRGQKIKVGVLGLGTGSIAAHCRNGQGGRTGDEFVFYEIDPRIERIARTYFSYLAHCKGSEVRLGDGRLLMQKELSEGAPGNYDLVVMDAFADDTVPAHLLTMQAVKLYAAHARTPESIIAIHTSNRYLDLPPVIFKEAAALGLNAMMIWDNGESNPGGSPSQWVLLVKDPTVFGANVFAHASSFVADVDQAPLWTDDYQSLFSVVDLAMPW
ncbi:MAG: hypothetical protein RLZZ416_626 [Candidatus Parcubacteria bacterium]|jgi:hypothetical protein